MLVQGEEGEEPRDAAVAVAERMDAQKIEDERRHGHKWRSAALVYGLSIQQTQLIDGRGCRSGRDGTKPHPRSLSGLQLDDLVLCGFPLTGIATVFLNRL